MNFKLEVIAFDIESCFIAQQCGATRIELCDNQAEGGTTPSYGFIKQAREKISTRKLTWKVCVFVHTPSHASS
jgi:copper homeostasis protein CutC